MAPWKKAKYLRLAKGKHGKARNVWNIMVNKVEKSLQHARYGRHRKPRLFRRQWIQTINAGSREHELTYSQFQHGVKRSNLNFNKKTLAMLAEYEPYSFKAVIDEIKLQNKMLVSEGAEEGNMDFYEAYANKYLVLGELEEVDETLYE